MTDRFPSISNMIDYINIRHESIENNNLFDYWMGFFYSSLSCWVQLNRFYIMCFVPLPCCGTYKEPHLPFTIKWIHRKRFHWGFQAANQSLCREISVRHSTSLYNPRSVQCLLTSVPDVLQHNSTHHSHWPVTAIILLESSYRMVVICIPTFQSFFILMFTWMFSPTVLKVYFEEETFLGAYSLSNIWRYYVLCSWVYGGLWIKYMYSAKVIILGTWEL